MDGENLHGVLGTIIKAIIFKISDMVMERFIGQMGVIIKAIGNSIYLIINYQAVFKMGRENYILLKMVI